MAEPSNNSGGHIQNGNHVAGNTAGTSIRQRASSPGSSDSEGGERPVRDQLKKTSIAGLSTKAKAGPQKGPHPVQESVRSEITQVPPPDQSYPSSRGRVARKRSFDDLRNDGSTSPSQPEADDAPPAKNGHHKRMRSRDFSSGEHVSLTDKGEHGATSPVEEESDADAEKSPGGPGILVSSSIDTAITPPTVQQLEDPESMISPKKKRSRDQIDREETSTLDSSEPQQPSSSQKAQEPDKKRHREEEQAVNMVANESRPIGESGFANLSSASPFGTFASSRSPDKQTLSSGMKPADSSAFKSSGLSAFASSEKSPFGALGMTSGSGFGGTTSSGGFGTATSSGGFGASSTSGFDNTGATSPFGAKSGSGFGTLGGLSLPGGFGSTGGLRGALGAGSSGLPTPFGGGVATFGGPAASTTTTFGGPNATKQKAFGAPEDEDESDGGDESGSQDEENGEAEESHNAREARLKEQTDRETGEEDEEVVIKCRAKLYHFENKEWKERGVGDLKVNVRFELRESSDEEAPQYDRKARIIMRTEHVHRVVLNTPIFKGMKVGNQSGDEPSGKFLNLAGMENGKPALFMLKIGKDEVVKELYHRIKELQEEP